MAKVANSTHIDADPQKVWAFINNLNRKHEYVQFVSEVFNISNEPINEGTVYQERARFGPKESVSEWKIIQFVPPTHQVQQSQSKEMNATFTADLQPEGSGTRLSVEMSVNLLPVLRPVGWLLEQLIVRRKMQIDVEQSLKVLKKLIEVEEQDKSH